MKTNFKNQELERRLNLYQVFLALYERHGHLLDEILQLENIYQPSLTELKLRYVQGVVDDSSVYVITNLCNNQTQTLQQQQQVWTIGRDRSNGIRTDDQHLSRYHAAIQYIENQGFYLVDFHSTNGSSVNGETVYQPVKLKDGDRIRLGSLTFNFFLSHQSRILPTLPTDLLAQLIPLPADIKQQKLSDNTACQEQVELANLDETLQISLDCAWGRLEYGRDGLHEQQKSEILDRYFQQPTNFNVGL
ncbi:FHA domain-containing protein [Nostoc sp. UHCC 0870]|uniref:FHA domain-containing protein n=1 Tax=Nostoc sp. UHCC 0870 TaxID=2914041 RepID=UPI001EDE793B|nr:FHA domain-containing protein [Nostoc sp. UHCC 0870]UKO98683.1 FHA domain-containing protein [Nostoc sp. UHCC 0870]